MEKIYLKPIAKEILVKGTNAEGVSDSFLYDSDNDATKRALGALYVIGNVQVDAPVSQDLDVAYMINLIASLAKREYYAHPELAPKEAFAAALKKINGVVEEFFKKEGTAINVGIFSLAGNQMYISKLGKFKILLVRDHKDIDILNNLNLFQKEKTEEKEFSSIVSGAIQEGDRVLAFYPSRTMTNRTKTIRDQLIKLGQDDFVATLQSAKGGKQGFACAAVHIDLQKSTEAAEIPRIQPKELKEEPVPEIPNNESIAAAPIPDAVLATKPQPALETPKIIPSEFARGTKSLPFTKQFKRLTRFNINSRNKLFVLGGATIAIIAVVLVLKATVLISPAQRALAQAVKAAQDSLAQSNTKASANDLAGARSLLVSSLTDLNQSIQNDGSSHAATDVLGQITQKLDTIEQATDATLSMVAEVPSATGNATLVLANGGNIYAYIDQGSGSGVLARVSGDQFGQPITINGFTPTAIYGSSDAIVLSDLANQQLATVALATSAVASSSLSGETLLNASLYQDNLYGLSADNIIKIANAATGKTTPTPWLGAGVTLPPGADTILVDGNVYIISADGTLTTYYKGQVSAHIAMPLTVDATDIIRTTDDGKEIYIISKTLGRVYIIEKDTGALSKTLKLNTTAPITDATVADDGTVYILSNNQVWKVQSQ